MCTLTLELSGGVDEQFAECANNSIEVGNCVVNGRPFDVLKLKQMHVVAMVQE